ncbi:MAG TPA: tRNA (adenosine(37)-N6)-threonylcarbamoyltransferase complex dimerization subunit type 1 TsaB [Chiayiivirga sp.]|nr:tRNA (adenosine(37)-N6)-threonylcarbamoyltransferase complex dimerization subunit type 1 TsaB [Chiayiivirga sp.]
MSRILALETATEACSVALWIEGEVLERFEVAPRRHAELALPWIEDLLAQAGLARAQLDAVACGRGPGAFTGVRLAVAITQGLALALDRPAVGVSTLEALALPAMRELEAAGDTGTGVLAAIDARMGEVYLADHARDASGAWARLGEERVLAPADFAAEHAGARVGVGTGFSAQDSVLTARLGAGLSRVDAQALPRAGDVARLAAAALARGEGLAPEDLQPAYLRNRVALTLAEQGKPVPSA